MPLALEFLSDRKERKTVAEHDDPNPPTVRISGQYQNLFTLFPGSQRSVIDKMTSPPAKRHKLDGAADVFASSLASDPSVLLTVRDLSFQSPLRKKLTLTLTLSTISAHSPAKEELSAPLSQIVHIICVPAPDKTTKTWNFVVVLKDGEGFNSWVFGVPDSVGKTAVAGPALPVDTSQSYRLLLLEAFRRIATKVPVVEPSPEEFSSPIPVPGRPKDTAFHVIAHRGAKEGYLFFLSTCILYGFRKPVLFFPLDSIREVTFTNILQRTFDLVVSTEENVDGEEFGMIDQAVFEGIMGYVKRHSIQDASLSELRKAKKLARKNGEDLENTGELARAVEEYEADYDEDRDHLRAFEKAEAARQEDEKDIPRGVGKRKRKPIAVNSVGGGGSFANGVDFPSDDEDEEEDETFKMRHSDDESAAGSGDDGSGSDSGSGNEEDEDDSDNESDDEDTDEEDEDEDMDEEDDDEDGDNDDD